MSQPIPDVLPAEPRFRHRMSCSLRIGGQVHRALVLNLSRGGLFVRTTARVRPGAKIELDLPLRDPQGEDAETIGLRANVVWRRVSASTMSHMNHGGIGLRLSDAPAAYDALVRELAGDRAGEPAAAAPTATSCFEVRIKQNSGPRSRWLQVVGGDETAACTSALARAGRDWEILEVRRAS